MRYLGITICVHTPLQLTLLLNNFTQIGLQGERLQIYSDVGSNKVQWKRFGSSADQRLIWYKVRKIFHPKNPRKLHIV